MIRNGIEVYAGNVSPNLSGRGRRIRWMGVVWLRFRVALRSGIGWEYGGDDMEGCRREVGEWGFHYVSVYLEMFVLRHFFQDGVFLWVDSLIGFGTNVQLFIFLNPVTLDTRILLKDTYFNGTLFFL